MKFFEKKHIPHLLLALIVIVGLFLRLLPAINNTFAFTYDVGRDMIALQQIIKDHNIPFIGPTTGLNGLFYGPWWYYMLTPFFFLSSGNPQGVAVFMALTGALTIILGYILGEKVRGTLMGIIFALLIAFSPLLIGISSQIWNPNTAPLWLVSILLLLFEIEKKVDKRVFFNKISKRSLNYFLLGLLLALSIDTEVVYGFLLCIAVVVYFLTRILKKSSIKEVALLISGFIFILLPKIIFELGNNFLMTRTLLNFASGGEGESFSINIAQTFINRFNFLLDFFGDTFGIENLFLILSLLILSIFVLVMNRKKISEEEKIILRIGIIILITYYLGLTLFEQDVWPHYIVGLPIIFVCILGITLNTILIKIQKKSLIALFLIIISLLLLKPENLYKEITSSQPNNDVAVFKNHLKIIDYIYKEANGEEFKYITYTPPLHDYTYSYLFNWYGEKKYGYTPTSVNKRLFFLILEPDFEDKTRLERWLKVREGDGVIKKEHTFPSGARVQLREIN